MNSNLYEIPLEELDIAVETEVFGWSESGEYAFSTDWAWALTVLEYFREKGYTWRLLDNPDGELKVDFDNYPKARSGCQFRKEGEGRRIILGVGDTPTIAIARAGVTLARMLKDPV